MAESIEELVVEAKPAGLEETSQGFQQMQGDLSETEGQMADTTGQLGDMQSAWQGAMGALVGGLAVAAAGLMSQIPVIGSAMSGLQSIVGAVAYQMDQVLRPILQPIANGFFQISSAIYDAEGILGTVIGVVSSLAAGLGILAGAAAAVGSAVPSLTALGAVSTVFSGIASVVGTVASAIAGLISLPALVIAAIAGFAAAYATNWMGIRDKTNQFVGSIISIVSGWVDDMVGAAKDIWDGVTNWFDQLVTDATGAISGLIDSAIQWGTDLISNIIQGIKNALPDLKSVLNQDLVAGVSINDAIGTVEGAISGLSGGGGGDGGGHRAQRSQTTNLYMDGRKLTEDTGRYRQDTTSRRGRHG